MSADLLNIITTLLTNTLALLDRIAYPGTSWSIFQLMVFAFFLATVIGLLKVLFMLPSSSGEYGQGGNNENIKVDEKRKNDKK